MPEYKIIWSNRAISQLNKLPKTIRIAVYKNVDKLKENPFRKEVKRLRGLPYFRLRIGDYRIIFNVKKNIFQILVVKVGHRKNIYEKL
jgi:mRNA interferase RelE/StbE